MIKMDIRGTIFEKLAEMDEIVNFGIVEDRKIIGGRELSDKIYVDKFIKTNVEDEDTFVYLSVPLTDYKNSVVARLIIFRTINCKNMWIAENYKRSLGLLNISAQKILN